METTLVFVANMEAIVLIIASVRATFVELECHCGKEILWPELSNLWITTCQRFSTRLQAFNAQSHTRSDCQEHHASQR